MYHSAMGPHLCCWLGCRKLVWSVCRIRSCGKPRPLLTSLSLSQRPCSNPETATKVCSSLAPPPLLPCPWIYFPLLPLRLSLYPCLCSVFRSIFSAVTLIFASTPAFPFVPGVPCAFSLAFDCTLCLCLYYASEAVCSHEESHSHGDIRKGDLTASSGSLAAFCLPDTPCVTLPVRFVSKAAKASRAPAEALSSHLFTTLYDYECS